MAYLRQENEIFGVFTAECFDRFTALRHFFQRSSSALLDLAPVPAAGGGAQQGGAAILMRREDCHMHSLQPKTHRQINDFYATTPFTQNRRRFAQI